MQLHKPYLPKLILVLDLASCEKYDLPYQDILQFYLSNSFSFL